MPSSLSSISSKEDTSSNVIENYDILRQIGRGSRSVVHLAICKKGRIRNREVAVKEIPSLTEDYSIHQALHHPGIISCFSTFSSISSSYHVLEYCARGTLNQFLASHEPPTLEEAMIRGLLRTLVDALICLEKEAIVHRDITPDNVLITEDYRIKLANFGAAVRLSSEYSVTDEVLLKTSSYVAPEILSNSSHGFPADIWSLGCLTLTCIIGRQKFEDDRVHPRKKSASLEKYQDVSPQLQNLISDFLQPVPGQRIPVSRVPCHPFFDSELPTTSLQPHICKDPKAELTIKPSQNVSVTLKSSKPNPFEFRGPRKNVGTMSAPRRVFSDPVSGTKSRKKFLDSDPPLRVRFRSRSLAAAPSFVSSFGRPEVIPEVEAELEEEEPESTQLALLGEFEEALQSPAGYPFSSTPKKPQEIPEIAFQDDHTNWRPLVVERTASVDSAPQVVKEEEHRVSIGVTRPVRLDTSLLVPQTQKVNRGQLTILPSRSLLVDFREGERRKGKAGSEVLLIGPDGINVKVYSAPHLSSPCCLAEPVAMYPISKLPPAYWKQYNDATQIIEQLKQHVPKMIMYDTDTRCTVMANAPDADIELLFYRFCHDPSKKSEMKSGATQGTQGAHMRIRLLRKRQLVEISRQAFLATTAEGEHAGEWIKKVIVAPGGDLVELDRRTLDEEEIAGLTRVLDFVSLSDIIERHSTPSRPFRNNVVGQGSRVSQALPDSSAQHRDCLTASLKGASGDLSSPRLTSQMSRFSFLNRVIEQDSRSLSAIYEGFDTRFIPSVGWCVRYGFSGGAGRYKMMFFDGAILEVDVDGECVEFMTSGSNEVVRYKIRDCTSRRDVMDKMKAFKEFVSLFDDGEENL